VTLASTVLVPAVSEYVELVRVEADSVHIVEERIVAADSEHSVTVTQLDPLSLI